MANMTPKDILIKTCDLKFADIAKRSDINLWMKNDRNDLLIWSEDTAHQVLIQMGPTNCPWCIKYKGECQDCTYGKRHGPCRNTISDYRRAETERRQKYLPYLSEAALIDIGKLLKGYKKCQ